MKVSFLEAMNSQLRRGSNRIHFQLGIRRLQEKALFLKAAGVLIHRAEKIRGFVYTAPGDPVVANGATQMKLDTWHHLAMVYDGAEIRIYLDGELDGEAPRKGDINKNEASVWIGKKAIESVWLDGTLDELRILNIAITEAQIQQDMEEGITFAVEVTGKLTTTWGRIKSDAHR